MKRLSTLLIISVLLGITGLQVCHAQDGPDCSTTSDVRCIGLSQVNIVGAEALSLYPGFRNPMLELDIQIRAPAPPGIDTGYIYVDTIKQLGNQAHALNHCELVIVALSDEEDQYLKQQAIIWDTDREQRVRVFAFCKQINLPYGGDASAARMPFPSQSTTISLDDTSQIDQTQLNTLTELTHKLIAADCRDSITGEPITLRSFQAQLAVFLIFHTTPDETDPVTDAWQKFKDGGQVYVDQQHDDFFTCLLPAVSTPIPTPTPTLTPTPPPTLGPDLFTATPEPPTLFNQTIPDTPAGDINLLELLLGAGGVITAGVVVIVLTGMKRMRLALGVTALLLALGIALSILFPNFWENDPAENTLTPSPTHTPQATPGEN